MTLVARAALLGVALAVLSSVSARPARADQPPPLFLREYQAGIDAFRLGQYAEARNHLAKAIDIAPTLPGPYRWLAAVDQAQEKWDDCVAHARQAIKLNPQSQEIEATRTVHDQCRSSAGRSPFVGDYEGGGALAVTSNIQGAAITLNGLRYGVTPLAPRTLALGKAELRVDKLGYLPRTITIDILPQVVTDVDVTLEADPKAAPVKAKPEETRPVSPTSGWLELVINAPDAVVTINGMETRPDAKGRFERPPGTYEVKVTAPGYDRWRRRVRISRGQSRRIEIKLAPARKRHSSNSVGIGAVAGAAVLAGVGATFAILSGNAGEDARDWRDIERTRPRPDALPIETSSRLEPLHTWRDIEERTDRAKQWALVSDVAYGAAVVSLGVGVYFFARARSDERDGQDPPFALAPIVGGGAYGVSLSKEIDW